MQGAEQKARIAEVLSMIVCPVCHASLVLEDDNLRCSGCGLSYPMEDGIPALIAERGVGRKPE